MGVSCSSSNSTSISFPDAPYDEQHTCPICFEDMILRKESRMLRCFHTFCTDCLVTLVERGSITCPTCRTDTQVKDGQVVNLARNFYLDQFKRLKTTPKKRQAPIVKNDLPINFENSPFSLISIFLIEKAVDMCPFGADSVLVVDSETGTVRKITASGKNTCFFKANKKKKYRSVSNYGRNVYIAHNNGIIEYNMEDEKQTDIPLPHGQFDKFLAIRNNNFIFLDPWQGALVRRYLHDKSRDGRRILEYESTSTLLPINKPSYISALSLLNKEHYILTADMSDGPHVVLFSSVFSSYVSSSLVTGRSGSVDGVNFPKGTAVTENNNVLVADHLNDRISEFCVSASGDFTRKIGVSEFKRHVLTREHEIRRPTCLVYNFPYLWVAEQDHQHGCVKCFLKK